MLRKEGKYYNHYKLNNNKDFKLSGLKWESNLAPLCTLRLKICLLSNLNNHCKVMIFFNKFKAGGLFNLEISCHKLRK